MLSDRQVRQHNGICTTERTPMVNLYYHKRSLLVNSKQ
nr:MAG TPA: hypothetical protein [Caudoviricetes sp.]